MYLLSVCLVCRGMRLFWLVDWLHHGGHGVMSTILLRHAHTKTERVDLSSCLNKANIFSLNRVQHPRKFSKCSISDYKEFLLKGGGSCLFNRPTKVGGSHIYAFCVNASIGRNHTWISYTWLILAAIRGNRVREWFCRSGRGVRLRSQSGEFPSRINMSRLFVVRVFVRCV